ncbi:MAG: ribonuclease HI [Selenomonadaceae bacterium]|nr:ribonuclease HI [Selenomonadaceae bacterium]
MAQKKVYAVKRGRKAGLFTSWDDCKAQVDGFPGAIYKGFPSRQEAEAWLFDAPETISLFDDEKDKPLSRPRASLVGAGHDNAKEEPPGDYIVYTDGSCLRNPDGPGGYAAVIVDTQNGSIRELSGGEASTTNNRMELRAGIEALRALPDGATVDFYTDSQYMKNAFTKYWLRNWKRNGWKTATGEPVKNQDLWRALDEAFSLRTVRFHWVKGHAGNRWNERCDELARSEAAKFS